jgi:hypothetical protein
MTLFLLPLILNLRHAQGDRKGHALSSYKSLADWLQMYNRRVQAENYCHAKTLLRAFACGLRGKNTAGAPCVCLAIWSIVAHRQHIEARTAGCKTGLRLALLSRNGHLVHQNCNRVCFMSISHTELSILTVLTDSVNVLLYKIFVKWLSISRKLLFIRYLSLFSIKIEIFHAKYVCIQGLILCFKRDIDEKYVVVSSWVYLYLSAMSIRLDEIVKDYDCLKGSPEAWQKREIYWLVC